MSSITPSNINGNFPVFGQDNSTQGFRDNFTNIKSNFVFTKQEIEDIQAKGIFKSALNGTTLSNDMQGAILENPQLKGYTTAYFDVGSQEGSLEIDFRQGNFQKIETNGNITITDFINWPETSGSGVVGYASIRLWFVVNPSLDPIRNILVPDSISFPSSVNIGIEDNAGYLANTNTITFDVPGNYVFDISSADGGQNFLIFDNTRNRVRFRDPSFYFNPDVTPTLLIGFGNLIDLAVNIARTSDVVNIYGSMSSYSGVLDHGNQPGVGVYNVNSIDEELAGNARTAGYSTVTSRGFVDPVTLQFTTDTRALVRSDDYVGYYNFIGLSLDPTTWPASFQGAFTDFASIRSFASGSFGNIGPGGNLVFMTKRDMITSAPGTGHLQTAVAIENDQATHFFGPAVTHGAETSAGYRWIDLDSTPGYVIPADCPIVILGSSTNTPAASLDLVFPTGTTVKDGTKITISAAVDITALNFISSIPVIFINESYAYPYAVPGFPIVTVLTITANPYLETGMLLTVPPNMFYNSDQRIVSIIDNDYLVNYSGLANVIVGGPFGGNANVIPTPGVTPLNLYANDHSYTPASMNAHDSFTFLYRSADNIWYKI